MGWLLVAGGVSYVLSGLLAFLAPSPGPLVYILAIPPTIAEFWMIGWLLYTGWRRPTDPGPTPVAR
nr:DUF4386 family protein [Arthrobacter castelli]